MDTISTATAATAMQTEGIAERDKAFARMFKANEQVWLVGEQYNAPMMTWRVDFIRLGPEGRWMLQRYHYDVATNVVYFMGERPVEDSELTKLRRAGKAVHRARTKN